MKKTFTTLICLVFALFASQQIKAQSELLLDEPFAGSLGSFKVEGFNGDNNDIWLGEGDYIKADAYEKIGNEAFTNYLVSPKIDLGSNGLVNFTYMQSMFANFNNEFDFVVREVNGEWQKVEIPRVSDNMLGSVTDLQIPENFNGKTIEVGFMYSSQGSKSSGIIQIKNFTLYGEKAAEPQEPTSNIIFEEPFTQGLGKFVIEGYAGKDANNPIWVFDGCAKADAYEKADRNFENYLVSPSVKLCSEAVVAHFRHAWEYFTDVKNETSLCIRTIGGEWKTLVIPTYSPYEGAAQVVGTDNIEIPAEFLGKDVQFGFKYVIKDFTNPGVWYIQNFVVEKKTAPAEKVDPAISFAETEFMYMLESGDFTEPELINPNNVKVTYSSSDETIATVNAETGDVTAIAEGTVTITASAAESDKFLAGEASYTITVTAPAVTEVIFNETFKESLGEFTVEGFNGVNNDIWRHDIAFVTADAFEKITEPVENYLVSPVITLTKNNHIVHYAQSQDFFSSFANETSFLIRTVGGEWQKLVQTKIPAKGDWSETGNINIPSEFNGKDVQFAFRYSAQAPDAAGLWSISDFAVEKVLTGTDPKLSFQVENSVAFVGQEFTAPELNNPYNVEVTYSSSNTDVAKVDAQTGVVSILGEGTTTITATSVETEKFVSGKASYIITVSTPSAQDVEFEAYFDDNFCGFAVEGFNGGEMPIWKIKNGAARADAYTKVSEPTTNYLVSPIIKMSENGNTAEFNYKFLHDDKAKVAVEDEFGLVIREVGGEWTKLIIPNVNGNNEMVNSGVINIPASFNGKNVQIAFMYFAESGSASGVLTVDDIIVRKVVPTSIEGIAAEDIENGVIYDLQGRRVDQLGKGVFIVNGKKYVIK